MKEKLLKSRYLGRSLYALFFLFAFLVSFYLTIPLEDLKDRIAGEIEARTSLEAQIDKVSVSPIFNMKIHNITLYKAEKPVLGIEELKLAPSLFGLLISDKLKLPFEAHLLGGKTIGTIVYNPKTNKLEEAQARITGINVETIPSIIAIDFGRETPSFHGLLEGDFSVTFLPPADGEFAFKVSSLGIKKLRIKGLVLPDFDDIQSNLRGSIEGNITKIEELRFKGDGVDLMLTGTAPILWSIEKGGKVDLWMQLQLTGPKQEVFKKFLASYLAPQDDGSLGAKIAGTFFNPRLVKESSNPSRF
jgi:type II secretion system protein N